jgi:hypothetical protein
MLEMGNQPHCSDIVVWSDDLTMGCAIASTVLFRYWLGRDGHAVLVRGVYGHIEHAFVLVSLDDGWSVADPTFMQFGEGECRTNIAPFTADIRRESGCGRYLIERYTDVPSRACRLFQDWGQQSPAGRWKPILNDLQRRMGSTSGG